MTDTATNYLLEIQGLTIGFSRAGRDSADMVPVVRDLSLSLDRGETLGIVGESGSGKTMTAYAILDLIPQGGKIMDGDIRLYGKPVLGLENSESRDIRGNMVSMIFQEPMTALNPVFTIGDQISEAYRLHHTAGKKDARERTISLLDKVGIVDPHRWVDSYPHELSGGMRQRAMIAMALICEPDLLIADEPTTALDTTIQAQILDLLIQLQEELNMAVLFISHDIAVVSEVADRVAVMYAGNLVETFPTEFLLGQVRHPYTNGLLSTLPQPEHRGRMLPTLDGFLNPADRLAVGCSFAARCPKGDGDCSQSRPAYQELSPEHSIACFKADTA
ncbi:MAG: ABC transporter ATP-binding protein [Rhodospirillaceae bacterium]